jgi:cytochrome oxidase Cu insertion factor (SCO1/SenC/PrrC family)
MHTDWRTRRARAVLAAVVCLAAAATVSAAVDPGAGMAPRTEFVPPPAGTYTLQKIQPVRDAVLLDETGRARHLAALTSGKVTLLTFFYTACADALGCPFAFGTLHGLRARLLPRTGARDRVRFVSVSLDPTTDTPVVLARYAGALANNREFEWHFLTARSVSSLLPVLDDFGQDVSVELDAQRRPTRTLHHMLKMVLIDPHGTVREIYSLAFLQPEVIINDVMTLLREAPSLNARNRAPLARPILANDR